MKEKLIEEIQNLIYNSELFSMEEKEKYFKFFELLKDYPGEGVIPLLERVKKELDSGDKEKIKEIFEGIDKSLSLMKQGKMNELMDELDM